MSDSGERFTGRDVAEALAAAREKFGKTRRELGYRLVSDVKLGPLEEASAELVTIEAWPLRPEDVPPPPSRDEGYGSDRRGRRDRGPSRGGRRDRGGFREREPRDRDRESRDEPPFEMPAILPEPGAELSETDVARQAIEAILAGLDLSLKLSSVETTDEGIAAELEGEDAATLVADDAAGLESLQFLLNRLTHRHDKSFPRISLDAEGYRQRARDALVAEARKIAESVRETGETRYLPPMGPFERRLVHVELAQYDDLETHSEGKGADRRIAVKRKSSDGEQ